MSQPKQTGDDMPEVCKQCGGANPIWFAPNEVWNRVTENGTGILCPSCFLALPLAVGAWELRPDNYGPLETCRCEQPRKSWNPKAPCLACGGEIGEQAKANAPDTSASSAHKNAECEVQGRGERSASAQSATSERKENSRETKLGDDMPDPRQWAEELIKPMSFDLLPKPATATALMLLKQSHDETVRQLAEHGRKLMARCYLHAVAVARSRAIESSDIQIMAVVADLEKLAAETERGE